MFLGFSQILPSLLSPNGDFTMKLTTKSVFMFLHSFKLCSTCFRCFFIRVRAGTDYVGPWVRDWRGGWWVMVGCFRRVVSDPVSDPVARGSGGLFPTQKDMPNKTVMVRTRSGGIGQVLSIECLRSGPHHAKSTERL